VNLWKRKLAAWLHDPAEKALVLMRDVDNAGQCIGHEEGSVAALRAALGIARRDFDKRADHYAAAADRPQWPFEDGRPRPAWANVRFVEQPVLIHPLSGEPISLGKLADIPAAHIRSASLDHFDALIERGDDGRPDYRLTQLAFWRFGPEPALAAPELGELWRLLPADTRVPDHNIWQHLDVVSALAGAMAADDAPALLAMSFGPVQGFIAQARSTSDLWAGSHLLSSLVWEGLAVLCRALGPDAVLFPNLRGIAAVDRWLLQLAPHWRERFERIGAPWLERTSDANPLYAATLPNKFMAVVPAASAQALAEGVADAVRAKARQWATEAASEVFEAAGRDRSDSAHWRVQVREQLHGFPEIHWASAEWPVAPLGEPADATALRQALQAFGSDGLFGEKVWQVLNREVELDGSAFFKPNAGIFYPAVHDLVERALASVKSLRPFEPLAQQGFRCTLDGERMAHGGPDAAWTAAECARIALRLGRADRPLRHQGRRAPRRHRDAEAVVAELVCCAAPQGPGLRRSEPLRREHAHDGAGDAAGTTARELRRRGAVAAHRARRQGRRRRPGRAARLPGSRAAPRRCGRGSVAAPVAGSAGSSARGRRRRAAKPRHGSVRRRSTGDLLRAHPDGRRPHGGMDGGQRAGVPTPLRRHLAPAGAHCRRAEVRPSAGVARLLRLMAPGIAGAPCCDLRGAERFLDARRASRRRASVQGQVALCRRG
jgi:hypothetical protein